MKNKTKILNFSIITLISFALLYTIIQNAGPTKTSDITARKVLQAYKEINTALYKAQNQYGNFNDWSSSEASDKEKLENFVHNLNLKMKKDCGVNDISGKCWWSTKLRHYDKHGKTEFAKDAYTFIDKHNNAVYVYKDNHWGYLMVYDINGKNAGPNTRGKDIYYFQTGPDNVEFSPGGEEQLSSNKRLKNGCFKNGVCCAWIARTKNSEFLKANNDGICQNGKQLSWFNTTCK